MFVVGAAAETARPAGLPVDRIRITGYMLSGVLAAFAGLVIVGYYQRSGRRTHAPALTVAVLAQPSVLIARRMASSAAALRTPSSKSATPLDTADPA